MTAANRDLVAELVVEGLERREARWLVDEFAADDDLAALRIAVERRKRGEPIQYVLGHWPFRGLDLDVDGRVLIPRPESEELVGVALNELVRQAAVTPLIVDLGCGSGAIGLALLSELASRNVAATLVGVDESADALDVARANADKHGLRGATFVRSSWYDALDETLRGKVDLFVANPPYVGLEELEHLDAVLQFEPHGAIVSPDAHGVVGFADLAVIITGASAWLSPRGVLVCEHSNLHRDAAVSAARDAGFSSVDDLDDMAGHPRILVARRS
ncbi:MAG: peptide chain release factor N(5)-glutamine methyltransferase [Acidimicrobiales bacterium]